MAIGMYRPLLKTYHMLILGPFSSIQYKAFHSRAPTLHNHMSVDYTHAHCLIKLSHPPQHPMEFSFPKEFHDGKYG